MFTNKYTIIIETFSERHYLKNFQKKYKNNWKITWIAICESLERFDSLIKTSIIEIIKENNNIQIAKMEFRIAGTKQSRKASGNRCIIAINKENKTINILLIYHKNDLGNKNETEKWKKLIKNNYPEYKELF